MELTPLQAAVFEHPQIRHARIDLHTDKGDKVDDSAPWHITPLNDSHNGAGTLTAIMDALDVKSVICGFRPIPGSDLTYYFAITLDSDTRVRREELQVMDVNPDAG